MGLYIPAQPKNAVMTFMYRNHRDELRRRTVIVDSVEWVINPGYNYKPGWFISGHCIDKRARRSFALDHIQFDPSTNYRINIRLKTAAELVGADQEGKQSDAD